MLEFLLFCVMAAVVVAIGFFILNVLLWVGGILFVWVWIGVSALWTKLAGKNKPD